MKKKKPIIRRNMNFSRYQQGQRTGLYESYFLRGNHPEKPFAFWIRYTVFNPHKDPDKALGEIWATYFDGEAGIITCVKEELPILNCHFSTTEFRVALGQAQLDASELHGEASTGENTISWDLKYTGDSPPLFLFPLNLYTTKFPKAKSLVSLPNAVFNGTLTINKNTIGVNDWVGSQNHNWGVKHTDHYAWGQVAGFDNHPSSFLEVATARIKIGPLWTPYMTIMVLRHQGKEYALNTIRQSLKANGSFDFFNWRFDSEDATARLSGEMTAPRWAFAGLKYYNPPGGIKHCLNTKIAACQLKITDKLGGLRKKEEILSTQSRAAFEILTDDVNHGVKIYV